MKKKLFHLLMAVILLCLVVLFVFPLYLAIMNSLKPLGDILGNTLALPTSFFLDSYQYVFVEMNYLNAFINTFMITAISVIFIVILGSMCAYKLSRTNDRKSQIIMMLLFSSMIIPFQTIMLPLSKVAKAMNLTDSIPGLILMVIPLFAPFAIFMYHGFVKNVPIEVEEAAQIDGCSAFGIFFKIVFPMLKPITGSVIVLDVLWVWNDFALPLIMLQSKQNKTITITIYTFFSSVQMRWDYALSGLMLSSLPVLIFFIFMQRFIIKGVISGAVKG